MKQETYNLAKLLDKIKEEFVVEHMPQGRLGNRWYTVKPVSWEKLRDFIIQNYS